MPKSCRMYLLPLCLLALGAPVRADDAATAARLVGTWEGNWSYEKEGNKLTVTFKSATGDTLKGSSMWYGTAVGDFGDTFSKAKVKGDKLTVPEPTMEFKAILSEDGTTLTGTWTSPWPPAA